MTHPNGAASIREVYDIVQRIEEKMDARLRTMDGRLRKIERWVYAVPPTLLLATASVLVSWRS